MKQIQNRSAGVFSRSLLRKVLGLSLTGLILAACAGKNPARPVSRSTAVVKEGTISSSLSVSGIIVPTATATIYPRVSGTVKELPVDIGSKVRKGTLLARLDTRDLEAQLELAQASVAIAKDKAAQAEAALQTARLSMENAQRDFDRNSALFDSKVVTQSQLDDSKSRLDLAKAAFQAADRQLAAAGGSELRQALAQENLIQVQLENMEIDSPLDGTVASRGINAGEVCSPNTALMIIADTRDLKFRGDLPQEQILLLRGGERAVLNVDGLASTYEARIERIGPVAAASGQYFPVELMLKNDGRLLTGMTAKASIKIPDQSGLVIPLSSILLKDSKNFVFVVENSRLRLREIQLGGHNESQAIVLSGLRQGEEIATSSPGTLQDGEEVAQ